MNAAHQRWAKTPTAVIDTSFVMEHQQELEVAGFQRCLDKPTFAEVGVVVPLTVVEELERLKDRGEQADRKRARDALKLIESWFPNVIDPSSLEVLQHLDKTRSLRLEIFPDDELRVASSEGAVISDQTIVNVAAAIKQLSGAGTAPQPRHRTAAQGETGRCRRSRSHERTS